MRCLRLRARDDARGQALVEFAIVIPLFLLIVFGLIDLGRFVMSDSILSQSAREGARLAAVEAQWVGLSEPGCNTSGGPICPASVAALANDVQVAANRMVNGLGGTVTSVYLSCDAPGAEPAGLWTGSSCVSRGQGNVVSVRVVFTYRPITPVIGSLIGSVERHGAATMVIN